MSNDLTRAFKADTFTSNLLVTTGVVAVDRKYGERYCLMCKNTWPLLLLRLCPGSDSCMCDSRVLCTVVGRCFINDKNVCKKKSRKSRVQMSRATLHVMRLLQQRQQQIMMRFGATYALTVGCAQTHKRKIKIILSGIGRTHLKIQYKTIDMNIKQYRRRMPGENSGRWHDQDCPLPPDETTLHYL